MKRHLLIDCSFIREAILNISLALYAGRLLQGFRNSEVFDVTAIVRKGYESYIDEMAGYEAPFMERSTFQRIKDAHGLDKDLQQMIINCKTQFEGSLTPMNKDVLLLLESTIIQFVLFPIFQKKRSFFLRADKLLHSICRVLYWLYIKLKSPLS